MLTSTEITQETPSPKLTQEFLKKILTKASDHDLIEFNKWVKDGNIKDSQSETSTDTLMLSSKTAKELTVFFNKIAEKFDALFYRDCQPDRFSSLFYQDISSATKRLQSGNDLRPEQRLELQPSSYSGFDDKFSQQDFANILFVIAIANYACNKSYGEIEEDRFIDVLESMNKQKAKQQEKIFTKPQFQAVIPYPNTFNLSTLALNFLLLMTQFYWYDEKITKIRKKISSAENTYDRLETMFGKDPNLFAIELDKYNVTKPEINEMIKHGDQMVAIGSLGIVEAVSRTLLDFFVGARGKPNTNFLLFATSLFFASESLAEMISGKNLIKTISNNDESIFVDNRFLVDGLRFGLFFASQFDRRFGIDRIADNMIRIFSSLGYGVLNCTEGLFKSREVSDLESGPLIEDKSREINHDQIEKIAKELTILLAASNNIISGNTSQNSNSTPASELRVSNYALANNESKQK